MRLRVRWIALMVGVVVVAFGVVLAVQHRNEPSVPRLVQEHGPSLEFSVTALDGKKIDAASLRGKAYVVNFFNSWCIPCQQEAPALQAFYDEHKNDPDFAMVGIVRDDDAVDDPQLRRLQQGRVAGRDLRVPARPRSTSARPVNRRRTSSRPTASRCAARSGRRRPRPPRHLAPGRAQRAAVHVTASSRGRALAVVVVAAVVVLVVRSRPSNSPHGARRAARARPRVPGVRGSIGRRQQRARVACHPRRHPAADRRGPDRRRDPGIHPCPVPDIQLTPASSGIGLVAWLVPVLAFLLGRRASRRAVAVEPHASPRGDRGGRGDRRRGPGARGDERGARRLRRARSRARLPVAVARRSRRRAASPATSIRTTYRTLHDDYTARASAVIQSIDAGEKRKPRTEARSSPVLKLVTVGGIVVFCVLGAFLLAHAIGPRGRARRRPGTRRTARPRKRSRRPTRSNANPRDYNARITYARELRANRRLPERDRAVHGAAAQLDPKQPEPFAYRAGSAALVAQQITDSTQQARCSCTRRPPISNQAMRLDPTTPTRTRSKVSCCSTSRRTRRRRSRSCSSSCCHTDRQLDAPAGAVGADRSGRRNQETVDPNHRETTAKRPKGAERGVTGP